MQLTSFHCRMRSLIILALVLPAYAAEIPAGTELHARLRTPIVASTAKAGQRVDALLTVPVVVSGQIVISSGAVLTGEIKNPKWPNKPDERASLQLVFDKLTTPAGKSAKIDARVSAVDNARETVDDQGNILGILGSETMTARMDQGINKVTQRFPGLGEILNSIKANIVKEANTDISYDAGTDLTIMLKKPLQWTGAATAADIASIEPAAALAAMVAGQPFRTYAEKPPGPSDITNLMFLGTQEQLEQAFHEAGWSSAAGLSSESKLETARAIIEMRGYKEAPVSVLLLDGNPPDLVFQKQNNTFAQRHHLRIWRRPGTFNNRPIWVCSATHDIGIDFSPENRTFIHRIDPKIDAERAKVVNDLLFTKHVTAIALVDRPDVPTNAHNATGDELITDGRMAVLQF
jgi:hypothetical protein